MFRINPNIEMVRQGPRLSKNPDYKLLAVARIDGDVEFVVEFGKSGSEEKQRAMTETLKTMRGKLIKK